MVVLLFIFVHVFTFNRKVYIFVAPLFELEELLLAFLIGQGVVSDCDPIDCSIPGARVLHCLLEFTQIHVP